MEHQVDGHRALLSFGASNLQARLRSRGALAEFRVKRNIQILSEKRNVDGLLLPLFLRSAQTVLFFRKRCCDWHLNAVWACALYQQVALHESFFCSYVALEVGCAGLL